MEMQDKIERYLLVRMTENEKADFEIEMFKNPLLKEQVELERTIVSQIRNRAFVDEQIRQAKEELYQEKFESYTLDRMTEPEKAEFEYELKNNPILKEQLELKQQIVGHIQDQAFVNEQIIKAKRELKKGRTVKMISYSVTAIAAVFLLFFIIPLLKQNSELDKLYAANFEPFTDYPVTDGTYRGDNEIDSLMLTAMSAIKKQEFAKAESQFNQILAANDNREILYSREITPLDTGIVNEDSKIQYSMDVIQLKQKRISDNPEIGFYLAMAQLEIGKTKYALNTLKILNTQPNSYRYYEEIRWYLALANLKLHHKGEAKKYLDELVKLEGEYWDKAKELGDKL
jgi:hypothetical protein